jgi:curli biogenesis system outer membrane secretion channel CsgG
MPKAMEKALKEEARKKGLKGERKDAYVYGTISKYEEKHKGKGK